MIPFPELPEWFIKLAVAFMFIGIAVTGLSIIGLIGLLAYYMIRGLTK